MSNENASDLPAATAALSAEDREGLINALKDKLQDLAGKHTDVLETLEPKIRKRVEVLQEIQKEHGELESKFFEEKTALEIKYEKLYEPLYTKRYEIVSGVVEVADDTNEDVKGENGDKPTQEKGVPDFWLNAMKANDIVDEEISKDDEEALKYLKDIKYSRVDDPKGFKLDFIFDPNPFFKNSVLTKTYHLIDEDNEAILDKAIGTEIEWFAEKNLTQKPSTKKSKKGSKSGKSITKTEYSPSFFNFFSPPQIPENEEDLDEEDVDEDDVEVLHNQLEADYEIGCVIQQDLIPRAVSWFTGEAVDDDLNIVLEDDDEDDDDESDEEEEDKEEVKEEGKDK